MAKLSKPKGQEGAIQFTKLEKVQVKVDSRYKYFDIIAMTKSGTKYKMQWSVPDPMIDYYIKTVKERGHIYPETWKETK